MTWLMKVRLGLAAVGIVVWAYGMQVDDRRLGLIGISLLVVSLLLRFAARRQNDDDSAT